MRLLDRYIARTTLAAVAVVLLVISSLDLLSKLIDELGSLSNNYTFQEVLLYVGLSIPASIYKYMPFAALVGGLVGLGSLASTSELVIMRAAGVGLVRLTWSVMKPILWFIIVMLLLSEYVIPVADQYAENRRSLMLQGKNNALSSKGGLWNREGDEFMHFNNVQANGKLSGVTRYRYNELGHLVASSFAKTAIYTGEQWQQEEVIETLFNYSDEGVSTQVNAYLIRPWQTELSPDLLSILVQESDNLAISKLYRYAGYLEKQGINNDKYRLAYWSKVLQPLAIISLVLVAISFIFGPLREVTMGYRIFTGVVVGVVFQMVQKLLGPASLIYGFAPLFAVLIPIIICFFCGFFLLSRTR